MSGIVATEEIRDSLGGEGFNGCARADEIAAELAISVSTARRHLRLLMDRGWVAENVCAGPSGRWGAKDYQLTAKGVESYERNEGF